MKLATLAAGRSAAFLAFVMLAAPACGKKGPPLAPLVRVPAAPEATVSRLGEAVVVQLQVPRANADDSTPADVGRVEVYGYTGDAPDEDGMRRDGTLVATVSVRRPPEEPEEGPVSAAGPERPPGSVKDGFEQGDVVTVRETIGPAQREPVVPRRRTEPPEAVPESAFSPSAGRWVELSPPLGPPPAATGASRHYMAVGVARGGRRGPFTERMAVSLLPAPSAPAVPSVKYDEKTISLAWEPPADLRQPTLPARTNPDLLEARPIGMPSNAGAFNVFLVPPAAVGGQAGPADAVTAGPAPSPVNSAPLTEPRFEEPVPAGVAERCYVVRAISTDPGGVVQGEASEPACVTLKDVFPPAPPKALAGVGGVGAVSLIWERSDAPDLAGYLVLRSEGPGDPVALTDAPVAETTFRDEGAKPGVVYRYVVVAVDKAGNRSQPSNAVEESAR